MKILILIAILLNLAVSIKKKQLLSSTSMWIFCYALIFVVTPMITQIQYENEDLIDAMAFIGIICFTIGRALGDKIKIKSKDKSVNNTKYNINKVIVLYILITLSAITTLIASLGFETIQKLLTGGITSKQLALNNDSMGITIFSLLQNLQAAVLIIIFLIPNKKRIKYLLLLLFIAQNIIFSFTRIFVVCVLIILIMHKIRNTETRKQAILISAAVAFLCIFMVSMNYIRNLGFSNDYSTKDIVKIENIIEGTDFNVAYKYFDKLLSVGSPHIIPYAYLKPIYVLIPRSIWPNKPETLNIEILKKIDPEKANTGFSAATSVLGEGYAVLGAIGIIIYPLIWGIICAYQDKKYMIYKNTNNIQYLAFYYIFTTLIVISGQRGDWSTYFVLIVWIYLLPMYVMSRLSKKKKRALQDEK